MHDLLAAKDILETALKEADEKKLKKITSLVIEMGKVIDHGEAIKKENLEFNLDMVSKGTLAENAQYVIKETDGSDIRLVEIEGE
jgi:Zn finger protein HypA/HybF involved in hydrogenase expression